MNTVMIINQLGMGSGSPELGQVLMGAFLKKVWAREDLPSTICFYNEGVKLLASGSNVLDALDGLERAGVDLLACGTCLNHYAIADDLRVGQVSGMEEIVDRMMRADKVITI